MGSRLDQGSDATRKRIEAHTFEDEDGDEYEGSKFGGFSEYFRRKKIKLQNLDAELRANSAGKPQIFRGIVAHVNGYTQPSLNDLHTLIVSHGGGFMQYLDGKTQVTHIIASSLTPKKAVDFRKYRIVKPAWIVDSIAAERLLPWNDFRVVDEGAGQKVLTFDGGKIGAQVNQKQRGYHDQTDGSWYTSQLSAAAAPLPSHTRPQSDIDLGPLAEEILEDNEDTAAFREDVNETTEPVLELPLVEKAGFKTPPGEQRELLMTHQFEADETAGQQSLKVDATDTNSGSTTPRKGTLTAEEHNAILLSDPHIRKSSVLNPDFLEQYYRESRLHHLSTWKAELKSQLQALTAERTSSQKAQQKRHPGARRYILHVDFDSFFVAVSLKKHPQFRDKPAVVAHGAGSNSEIASCNYPARRFGIKNGMWMKRAHELCEDLKVLPYDFPGYEAASKLFYEAILQTGGIVQSVSIDEALVDVTALCLPAGGTDGVGVREGSIWREQEKAAEIAQSLRDRVKTDTGCAVSVGIGGNILLAKVALRRAKPAGQHQVKPEEAIDFLGELQVQDLPGVAYSIGGKLEEIGAKFVRDLREVSKERLTTVLGPKTGEKLFNYARGIDKTEVGDQVVRKSVSAEVNWGVRFETKEQVDEFIDSLCGELERRLLKEGVRGKQLTMKIMRRAVDAPLDPPKHLGHGKCDVFNKSVALGLATNTKQVLAKEALSILRSYGCSPGELRGLGVQMTKLEPMRASGPVEGSQPRLQFKPTSVTGHKSRASTTTTTQVAVRRDESETDPANKHASQGRPQFKNPGEMPAAAGRQGNAGRDADVVEEPKTPQKTKSVLARTADISSIFRNHDSPSRKPLNTAGTQFLLPSQADPKILAELPEDIRGRLARQMRHDRDPDTRAQDKSDGDPTPTLGARALGACQIDSEMLEALPADVRAEILADYAHVPHVPGQQTVLPQSPRKTRTVGALLSGGGRKAGMTVGRGRSRGGSSNSTVGEAGGAQRSTSNKGTPTLTQANFVAPRSVVTGRGHGVTADGISADFLAALPPDIRREVVDEHRRAQLQRKGGLEVQRRRGASPAPPHMAHQRDAEHQHAANSEAGEQLVTGGARAVQVSAKPARATFTVRRLSEADEVRSALRQWVDEFSDEGPYDEDVGALCRFLGSVMGEGDMDKATSLVRWLDWLLGQRHGDRGQTQAPASGAQNKWKAALAGARQAVAAAAHARGLANVIW